jgi:hypothetical protein
MPAPRSILIDIHDRGLDPKVAHKSVDSNGRIKVNQTIDTKSEQNYVRKQKTLKSTRKAEPKDETQTVDVSPETSTEIVSNEGAGSVEHKQQEAVAEAPTTTRRSKRNATSNT